MPSRRRDWPLAPWNPCWPGVFLAAVRARGRSTAPWACRPLALSWQKRALMFESSRKRELMQTFGRVQGMATRRTDGLKSLVQLPEVILDEGDKSRPIASKAELQRRRQIWDDLGLRAGTEKAQAERMIELIESYSREVAPNVRSCAERSITQCHSAMALAGQESFRIDAALS
jgi:hypothetical protein